MKFQYALDLFSIEESIDILKDVYDVVDVIECGTPMIIHYGMKAVEEVHKAYPNNVILADLKICDGGEYESDLAFKAGASIVTVMGFTNDETIQGVVRSAKKNHGYSFVDMMKVEDVVSRSKQLLDMGVDYICIHNATDALNMKQTIETTKKIVDIVGSEHLVIAGGVSLDSIEDVVNMNPEIIVVGTSVHKSKNKREMILNLKEKMK